MTDTVLLDTAAIDARLDALAAEILAHPRGNDRLALIGIVTRGETLALRLRPRLERALERPIDFGILDISLYRDDRFRSLKKPLVRGTQITFDIEDARIVLIDDVCYTGRTVRAAIDHIIDFGRPKAIELAVLVDRGHRELPIMPTYAGLTVATKQTDRVQVRLTESDGADEVILTNGTSQ